MHEKITLKRQLTVCLMKCDKKKYKVIANDTRMQW